MYMYKCVCFGKLMSVYLNINRHIDMVLQDLYMTYSMHTERLYLSRSMLVFSHNKHSISLY